MKVVLSVVGRLKERYWTEAEAEYRKRLRPYCQLEVVEHKDDDAQLTALARAGTVIALDERGPSMSSPEFARDVLAAGERGTLPSPLVFAIGGADGHGDALRARAQRLLSFGRLTIAHRLVRILMLEQIYRGFRIVRGEPYHRD